MVTFERQWEQREAVLNWLGERVAEGVIVGVQLSPYELESELGVGEEYELVTAIKFLRDNRLIDGTWLGSGGGIGVNLTPRGESILESGRSLREALAHRGPVSAGPNINISGIQGSNVSVGSGNQQTVTNTDSFNKAVGLADLIDRLAGSVSGQAASDAREMADAIRTAAHSEDPDVGRLRQLVFTAATSLAAAFGADIGGQVLQAGASAFGAF